MPVVWKDKATMEANPTALKKGDPMQASWKLKKKDNALITGINKKVTGLHIKGMKGPQHLTREKLDRMLSDVGLEPAKQWEGADREGKEYRYKQIHRLIMRGVPSSIIISYIGYTSAQFYKDTQEIEARLKFGIASMDYPLFVSQTLAFFNEAREIALRWTSEQVSMTHKIQALRVAIEAEEAKHRYLHLAGLYRAATPITPATQQQDDKDFEQFVEIFSGNGELVHDVAPS